MRYSGPKSARELTLDAETLGSLLTVLHAAGYDIVRIGDVPPWMERVRSLPAKLFRLKELA